MRLWFRQGPGLPADGGRRFSMSEMQPSERNCADQIVRLRRAFDEMPKVPGHGTSLGERHGDMRKEWVMRIIAAPYDRWEEYVDGERRTVLVGRVSQSRQWLQVVFVDDPETGRFLTAYRNRRLNKKYGGGPWEQK